MFSWDCRELNLPQKELAEFFVDGARLALNDGSIFGKEGEGFMRLNAGCRAPSWNGRSTSWKRPTGSAVSDKNASRP